MNTTAIEWTDYTWNPVTGCTPVSEGCRNCYARRMAQRLRGRFGYPADDPFRVTLHADRLGQPFYEARGKRIFVCSMGDLFHPDVPDDFLDEVFFPMYVLNVDRVFIVLTKRPERMRDYLSRKPPLPPTVWPGVSVENQAAADERIPILLDILAAVRVVSVEPMLGLVDLHNFLRGFTCPSCGRGIPADRFCWAPDECGDPTVEHVTCQYCGAGTSDTCRCSSCEEQSTCTREEECDRHNQVFKYEEFCAKSPIGWVICGGETGPGARPMHPNWVRDLRDQCQAAGVAFYFKSWGEWAPAGWVHADSQGALVRPDGHVCRDRAELAPSHNCEMVHVGRKRAGRLLDGRTWDEYPGGQRTCDATLASKASSS